MSTRTRIKLLLVGEFEVSGPDPLASARAQLDAFREAVQPASEYGLTLYQATAEDVASIAVDAPTLPPASERWQIRGREMALLIHRLAPFHDVDALALLQGAVEEGWVTETQVNIGTRAAGCNNG